jgi:hypothetical protein
MDKQSLREWIANRIEPSYRDDGGKYADIAIKASCQIIADSILSHLRDEIEKVDSRLTDEELITAMRPYESFIFLSEYGSAKFGAVAKFAQFKYKQAILREINNKIP